LVGPAVFTWWQKFALLAGFAALILLRLPEATRFGRFQDEEGPIFFAYAWHRGAGDALWRSFAGYLNLAANATTLLAARLVRGGYLPLEHAPRLTMAVALAVQMLPAVLLLSGRARWLTQRWAVIASLLLIALPPFTEEVWLNVLHVQYHLILCCGIILALDPPRTAGGWLGTAALLLLAPLCGPGALVLGPLFLARSWFERSLARLAQTALLGAAGLVQLLVFYTRSPVRGTWPSPDALASILFVRLGALPFTGMRTSNRLGAWAVQAYARHDAAWWLFAGVALAYCAVLAVLVWRRRSQAAGWLIAAGLALAVVSFGGGMIATNPREWFSVGSGERYNFLPLALLGLGLVAIAQEDLAKGRLAGVCLCALAVVIGARSFSHPIPELSTGPRWRSEAALWRADHGYQPRAWPGSWRVDLTDRDQPCPPATLETASYAAPVYCESNWLARVLHGAPKS
jgi:hypothetical protein